MDVQVQEKCLYHNEIGGSIKTLSELQAAHSNWQSAEEVHRANMYKVLTDVQAGQGRTYEKINELEIALHKEFATKQQLVDVKDSIDCDMGELSDRLDSYLLKTLGIIFGGGVGVLVIQHLLGG